MSRHFDVLIHIGEHHDACEHRDGVDAAQGLYYAVEAYLRNGAVFAGPRLELDRVGLKLSALQQDAGAHGRAAVTLEDNYSGRDQVLLDTRKRLVEELAVGPGEDLMPAWRPGRMELVDLGQAEGRTEAP